MQHAAKQYRQNDPRHEAFRKSTPEYYSSRISCSWKELRTQLINQWPSLGEEELKDTGPDRHRIAELISSRYGISTEMVENYLNNFERTMPMAASHSNTLSVSGKDNDSGEIH